MAFTPRTAIVTGSDSGIGDNAPLLEMTLEQWRHTVATDLDGAFVCIQRAAKRMVAAGNGGRIIAITSVHEHQPRVGSSAYDAAKHGLGGLVKTAALEPGRYGITGNAFEIAAVVGFLASPAASYVTGASWAVDGGMLQMGPQAGSHLESDDWREG